MTSVDCDRLCNNIYNVIRKTATRTIHIKKYTKKVYITQNRILKNIQVTHRNT